jgi:hypothetical protein
MTTFGLAALAAASCSGGGSAAAAAGPASGTGSVGPLATDGKQIVAWVPELGVVRVANERTGATADHPAPGRCAGHLSELRVGGGQLALLCWDDARIHSRLAVLDLARGVWRDLPDPGDWRRQLTGGIELFGVGARWLQLGTDTGSELIDLRDGSRRPADGATSATATAIDLDAEQPYVPACDSLTAGPFAYEPPYALTQSRRWIALWRCGAARPAVLDDYVTWPQLGSGIVSWERAIGNAAARVYLPSCRLVFAWRGYSFDGLAHTRDALYISATGELRRAPLPRRCPRPATLRIRRAGDRPWTTVRAQLWPASDAVEPLALRPPGAAAPASVPVVRRGPGRLELRLPHPASSVTWRVGPRRWNATARGSDGRRWQFPGPRRAGRTRIAIEARDRTGTVAQRYLLAIGR